MKLICNLSFEYNNNEESEKIFRSIKVDDFDFVKSTLKDKHIDAIIESKSISSLIHTLDDYLSCISVAEKIVDENK